MAVALAERRSREKWSDDPRNTKWSKNKDKFGYRMLEKMGWKEGRGLGLQEDGKSEHLKVSKKTDNLGLGAKAGLDDGWTGHQTAFEELLGRLNKHHNSDHHGNKTSVEQNDEEFNTKCLFKSAANSKVLKYSKFLKGKDLASKSQKDLNCILGRRKRVHEQYSNPKVPSQSCPVATSHGITTVTRKESMVEYFQDKMATFSTDKSEAISQDVCPDVPPKKKLKGSKKNHKLKRIL